MKAYSDDLRTRVVAAYAVGDSTIAQVAARFRVSESFVHKLLRRQRTSGSLAALPPRGGPAPALDAASQVALSACVARQPDATLAELAAQLAADGGPCVGQTTIWKSLRALNLRRKKKYPRRRAQHRAGEGSTAGFPRNLAATGRDALPVGG